MDNLLLGCFTLQKIYGREPESYAMINQLFHKILGEYPSDKVLRAFETWLARNQEFPTPADIIGLIKRHGRPPLRESDIITARNKDGADRTREDWALLREWEREQHEGWRDEPDTVKDTATLQENVRLRQQVRELQSEIARLGQMLSTERVTRGTAAPAPSVQDKVAKTIAAMRQAGAPEADIEEFQRQYA